MAIPLGFEDVAGFMSRIPLTSSSSGSALTWAARGLGRLPSLISRLASDGRFYDDPEEGTDVKALLESKYIAEKAEGMKRLLALMSIGSDVSQFFPQVVKNIAVQSLHVKRMVYIYLAHYSQRRPDEALLAINSLQREISDPNALVRAQALRTLSSIRIPTVIPLAVMSVKKCSRDPSPFVRRCAAHSLLQIHHTDRFQYTEVLEELVEILLGDSASTVLGPAAAAFLAICPNRLDLIGQKFLNFCQSLRDMDEWAQVVVLHLLLRYVIAKHGPPKWSMGYELDKKLGIEGSLKPECEDVAEKFSELNVENTGRREKSERVTNVDEPIRGERWERGESSIDRYEQFFADDGTDQNALAKTKKGNDDSKAFSGNHRSMDLSNTRDTGRRETEKRAGSERESGFREGEDKWDSFHENLIYSVHNDVKLLLKVTTPLLHSRNSAVVMGAAGVKWHLEKKEELKKVAKPLLFLLKSSPDSQYVVLSYLATMAQALPSMFDDLCEEFFICAIDTPAVRTLKLGILATIATEHTMKSILDELKAYLRDPDGEFVGKTIQTIASCATRLPNIASACMEELLYLAHAASETASEFSRGETNGSSVPSDSLVSGSSRGRSKAVKDERVDRESDVKGRGSGVGLERNVGEGGDDTLPQKGKLSSEEDKERRRERESEGGDGVVVREAVAAIRSLVQQRPAQHEEALARLLRNIDRLRDSEARATAVWLAGEYCGHGDVLPLMAPLVMKYMALHFKIEDDGTKLQILNSTVKVFLRSKDLPSNSEEGSMKLLLRYLLDLAKHDPSYDIRDKGRMIRKLLAFYNIEKEGEGQESSQSESHEGVEHTKLSTEMERRGRGRVEEERGRMSEIKPIEVSDDRGKGLDANVLVEGDGLNSESDLSFSVVTRGEASSSFESKWGKESSAEGSNRQIKDRSKEVECESEREKTKLFLADVAKRMFLSHKPLPAVSSLLPNRSKFYIGSLSHVVNHRAPGYEPLPEPNSLREISSEELGEAAGGIGERGREASEQERDEWYSNVKLSRDYGAGGRGEGGDSESESGSFYSSEYSDSDEEENTTSNEIGEGREGRDTETGKSHQNSEIEDRRREDQGPRFSSREEKEDLDLKPLIDLSDSEIPSSSANLTQSVRVTRSLIDWDDVQDTPSSDFEKTRVDSDLTSWPKPIASSEQTTDLNDEAYNGDWASTLQRVRGKPKRQKLLDFTSGEGLEVDFSVDRERRVDGAEEMVSIRLYYQNRSSETILNIVVMGAGETGASSEMLSSVANTTSPTVIPTEEVVELGVGQTAESLLYVNCSYHLKPVRLIVTYNGRSFPCKLALDVGSLVQPKAIEIDTFERMEQQLVGMHETRKRCILCGRLPKGHSSYSNNPDSSDIQFVRTAVQKLLAVAHLALISANVETSTLHSWEKWCLRFSGQTLLGAQPCLISVENEGAVLVDKGNLWRMVLQIKVNCENTILGLSLLKAAEDALKLL